MICADEKINKYTVGKKKQLVPVTWHGLPEVWGLERHVNRPVLSDAGFPDQASEEEQPQETLQLLNRPRFPGVHPGVRQMQLIQHGYTLVSVGVFLRHNEGQHLLAEEELHKIHRFVGVE